jgi:hypothetical protein
VRTVEFAIAGLALRKGLQLVDFGVGHARRVDAAAVELAQIRAGGSVATCLPSASTEPGRGLSSSRHAGCSPIDPLRAG